MHRIDCKNLWVTVLHLDWENSPLGPAMKARLQADIYSMVDLYSLGMYKKVASVCVDSIPDAIICSQNSVDYPGIPWTSYAAVEPTESIKRGGEIARSTMPGDILILEGQAYGVGRDWHEVLPISPVKEHLV